MVRIGSGIFKGRKIKTPNTKLTRVSTSYFRKVIFDTLAPFLEEAVVLDLFAGSGSLGLEALSRSAKSVLFVESGRLPALAIKENITTLQVAPQATLHKGDVFAFLEREKTPFDLIFLDPPYHLPLEKIYLLLQQIDTKKLLAKEGAICLEISSTYKEEVEKFDFSSFSPFKTKTKGETTILFYS